MATVQWKGEAPKCCASLGVRAFCGGEAPPAAVGSAEAAPRYRHVSVRTCLPSSCPFKLLQLSRIAHRRGAKFRLRRVPQPTKAAARGATRTRWRRARLRRGGTTRSRRSRRLTQGDARTCCITSRRRRPSECRAAAMCLRRDRRGQRRQGRDSAGARSRVPSRGAMQTAWSLGPYAGALRHHGTAPAARPTCRGSNRIDTRSSTTSSC